jgi:hypothetical protein
VDGLKDASVNSGMEQDVYRLVKGRGGVVKEAVNPHSV